MDLQGNGNPFELGYCTGDVHVAAVTGFAMSDARQQNCILTPRAICQSKKGRKKKQGRKNSEGKLEGEVKELHLLCIRIASENDVKWCSGAETMKGRHEEKR